MRFKKNIRLRVLMAENDMTQLELSKKASISPGLLSLGINGRYLFNEEQRKRLAKTFNTTVEDIFKE